MKITSIAAGDNAAVQQISQDRKHRLPLEQSVNARQAAAPLPLLQGQDRQVSSEPNPNLEEIAVELDNLALSFDRRLKFVVNNETREVVVKVIDNNTDTVIRELPPEAIQRLNSRVRETIGLLFDRTV